LAKGKQKVYRQEEDPLTPKTTRTGKQEKTSVRTVNCSIKGRLPKREEQPMIELTRSKKTEEGKGRRCIKQQVQLSKVGGVRRLKRRRVN